MIDYLYIILVNLKMKHFANILLSRGVHVTTYKINQRLGCEEWWRSKESR